MSAIELKVYEILKSKFGEQEATTVIEYFEAKAEEKYRQKKDVLATKQDIGETKQEISAAKVDLIKWMVGFWIAQMAAIVGLYLHK
jgi:hypothetical protein